MSRESMRALRRTPQSASLPLPENARIAVIGGGPAGSFFSYFLLELGRRIDAEFQVDIFEPRDYSKPGPGGCNMCGGIISESLVQALATEGINLPSTVVERGIDSYMLHMNEGSVRIATPLQEQRIAAVHRGAGPRGMKSSKWLSFDGHLLGLAERNGARIVRTRAEGVDWTEARPRVVVKGEPGEQYDLVAVATGVNSAFLKTFETGRHAYRSPRTTRTYICEFLLGQQVVDACMGNAMHVFLLDIPRLEFAALVPKGDYATLCLLGDNIDHDMVQALVNSPQVRSCLPADWTPPAEFCHCGPHISVSPAERPYADRLVFLGDAGVTRLYKDGIGAAYRTAKAAASTAVFKGVSTEDFKAGFFPTCKEIAHDNLAGKFIFWFSRLQQQNEHDRRGILRMVAREQQSKAAVRRMSSAMWDLFTGSAPYRSVLLRTMHPGFLFGLLWHVMTATVEHWRGRKAPAAHVARTAVQSAEQAHG